MLKSMALHELGELIAIPGVRCIDLQYGDTSEERGMVPIWIPFKDVLSSVMQSKTKSPTLVVAVLALAARRNSESHG
jgi:hypothetical protein